MTAREPVTAYLYDPATFLYMGTDIAPPDPLDEENFLIPIYATLDAPPGAEVNKAILRQEGAWVQVDDFRGTVLFSTTDKSKIVIRNLGPLPDDYTALDPSEIPAAEWDGSAWVTNTDEHTAALWAIVRSRRNGLLYACDWTQLPDVPLSVDEKSAFATYRQALRDVPQNYKDPSNVTWPTPPA